MKKVINVDGCSDYFVDITKSNEGMPMLMPLAVNVDQTAKMVGCSRSKLYMAIAKGELEIRKQGRKTIILVSELQRYLEALPTSERSASAETLRHLV